MAGAECFPLNSIVTDGLVFLQHSQELCVCIVCLLISLCVCEGGKQDIVFIRIHMSICVHVCVRPVHMSITDRVPIPTLPEKSWIFLAKISTTWKSWK